MTTDKTSNDDILKSIEEDALKAIEMIDNDFDDDDFLKQIEEEALREIETEAENKQKEQANKKTEEETKKQQAQNFKDVITSGFSSSEIKKILKEAIIENEIEEQIEGLGAEKQPNPETTIKKKPLSTEPKAQTKAKPTALEPKITSKKEHELSGPQAKKQKQNKKTVVKHDTVSRKTNNKRTATNIPKHGKTATKLPKIEGGIPIKKTQAKIKGKPFKAQTKKGLSPLIIILGLIVLVAIAGIFITTSSKKSQATPTKTLNKTLNKAKKKNTFSNKITKTTKKTTKKIKKRKAKFRSYTQMKTAISRVPQNSRKNLKKIIAMFEEYKSAYPQRDSDVSKCTRNITKIKKYMNANFPK